MDFLIQEKSDSDSESELETNEQIQQRLLEDMARLTHGGDQLSQFDEKSLMGDSILKDLETEENQFNDSAAWKEF